MQLKHLKLAGFKSFADPTVLDFPSELVAVVGPNGCGKSNIIDAIRWVLGESSAKQLRGESMEDVIFNGSSERKPVGQASVEMVFDNSLGRFTGAFAQYNEISIRRLVTRDGTSSWFLNNTRCRRKDILDLFSGTGARGYSIISQGEISRLIEARPEVLRAHLEEAAGVSLYKERRKETLHRMERTQENLARVADIREELDKQLQKLEKQAEAARQYLAFKNQEKLCRAEILALKQRDFSREKTALQAELDELLQTKEQQTLETLTATSEQDVLQQNLQRLNDNLQQKQQLLYESGLKIARLQENLLQIQRETHQLTHDEQQIKADLQTADTQKKACQEAFILAQEQTQILKTQIDTVQMESDNLAMQVAEIRDAKNALEKTGAEKQQQYHALSKEMHGLTVNLENSEKRQQEIHIRLEKLQQEKQSLTLEILQKEAQTLEQAQAVYIEQKEAYAKQKALLDAEKNTQTNQLQALEKALSQQDDDVRQTSTQLAALKAAQMAASRPEKPDHYPVQTWLSKPRLVDILQVEKTWQQAVEQVLGNQLTALVLDNCAEFWPHLAAFTAGEQVVTVSADMPKRGLAAHIKGAIPAIFPPLNTIYTAASLDEAFSRLPNLQTHESLITREGYWMGQGWIHIPATSREETPGLLKRQETISILETTLHVCENKLKELRNQRDSLHESLQKTTEDSQKMEAEWQDIQATVREGETRLAANQQQQNWCLQRTAMLEEEGVQWQDTLEELLVNKQQWSERQIVLKETIQTLEREQAQWESDRKALTDKLLTWQQTLDSCKNTLHEAIRAFDKNKTREEQSQTGLAREEERLIVLQERLEKVLLRKDAVQSQSQTITETLQKEATCHQDLEIAAQQIKNDQALVQESLEKLARKLKDHHHILQTLEKNIAGKTLEVQAIIVRITALLETLAEQDFNMADLLPNLDDAATVIQKEKSLEKIMQSISQLGAINLAAVEECSQTAIRKQQLDAQYADLEEALSLLTSAIEKMDQETRARLSDTFHQINDLFQALFPQLFGGGKARLEWTDDNVLEAGVLVMAQPPGKRNSSIQLLSGGEKAMTAIALVFAIFQLNPSPFCMLDEVDAPLDEVNVSRFCKVVKEMSKFVQFLFITHNKTTMELANQLIGVTMREPGISRLVTVDIKQALTLE